MGWNKVGNIASPRRVEDYSATCTAAGVAKIVFSPAFAAIPQVNPKPIWNGAGQMVIAEASNVTKTGCDLSVKISQATVLLNASPFTAAPVGTVVKMGVIG